MKNYPPEYDSSNSIKIKARFVSYCALTGEKIEIGDECLFDRTFRRVYSKNSRYYATKN